MSTRLFLGLLYGVSIVIREMMALIEQASDTRKVNVTSIDAGHCANVSKENGATVGTSGVLRKVESDSFVHFPVSLMYGALIALM